MAKPTKADITRTAVIQGLITALQNGDLLAEYVTGRPVGGISIVKYDNGTRITIDLGPVE